MGQAALCPFGVMQDSHWLRPAELWAPSKEARRCFLLTLAWRVCLILCSSWPSLLQREESPGRTAGCKPVPLQSYVWSRAGCIGAAGIRGATEPAALGELFRMVGHVPSTASGMSLLRDSLWALGMAHSVSDCLQTTVLHPNFRSLVISQLLCLFIAGCKLRS